MSSPAPMMYPTLRSLRDLHTHDGRALDGRLVVEESADVRTRDQAVAFAEFAAVGSYHGVNPIAPFSGTVGQDLEFGGVFATLGELDTRRLRFHLPALGHLRLTPCRRHGPRLSAPPRSAPLKDSARRE